MNRIELTLCPTEAKMLLSQSAKPGTSGRFAGHKYALAMLLGSAIALSGCVSVKAPDKPIVIELNINIKQEVIYRLAEDAKETIEGNPDVF